MLGASCVQKRAKQREELQLERYETPPPSDDEADEDEGEPAAEPQPEAGEGRDVKVYRDNQLLTTVTTSAITLYSDDEEECGSSLSFFQRNIAVQCCVQT